MELLEYQAKALFHAVGIPVLPSQPIASPGDLKRLNLPFPVVLKSQVRARERGKVGGVRFVENTIDAIAATRAIFNLAIEGEYPDVILAETRFAVVRELYLAVAVDFERAVVVLLGSSQGGTDLASVRSHLKEVAIEREFAPFYARQLALEMELSGQLMLDVAEVLTKMYRLLVERDLNRIEINPLGIDKTGRLMALDGKVQASDRALFRQRELARFQETELARWHSVLSGRGEIIVASNSLDLVLVVHSLLAQQELELAKGVVLSEQMLLAAAAADSQAREDLHEAVAELVQDGTGRVILACMMVPAPASEVTIEAIAEHYGRGNSGRRVSAEERRNRPTGKARQPRSRSQTAPTELLPPLVLYLPRGDQSPSIPPLAKPYLHPSESLEEAVRTALRLRSRSLQTENRP